MIISVKMITVAYIGVLIIALIAGIFISAKSGDYEYKKIIKEGKQENKCNNIEELKIVHM